MLLETMRYVAGITQILDGPQRLAICRHHVAAQNLIEVIRKARQQEGANNRYRIRTAAAIGENWSWRGGCTTYGVVWFFS